MKKNVLVLVLIASLAFTALAALAFANNLVAVVRWWQAFLAAGGNTSGLPARVPGVLPWLDWSAVDYSAVTTFIPFLGGIMLVRAAWQLLRKKPVPAADFPFFPGSDQLNVALGLFGTLWGIITIGYFRLDTVTMANLMQCLHTALFSTLMAVVWVFLVDRPLVRPLFQKLLASANLVRAEEGDLAGAVDRLVNRLDAAGDAFAARQKEFEAAFTARQKEFSDTFAAQQTQFEAAFNARQRETTALCEKHLADYEAAFEKRQKEYVELFTREIAALERRAAAAEAKAAATETKLNAVAAALRS